MRCAALVAVLLAFGAMLVYGGTVPQVSYTEATIPASLLGPAMELECLTSAEQNGSEVVASIVCYEQGTPFLMITDIEGSVSQNVLILPLWDCVELVPGVYAVSMALAVDLVTDTGMTILVEDITAPLTCMGAASYGALTLARLPASNDWDGDGCTDQNELDSSHDPFDPDDCGTGTGDDGVGGIAEMPSLIAHTQPTSRVWGAVMVLIGAAMGTGLGYAIWGLRARD